MESIGLKAMKFKNLEMFAKLTEEGKKEIESLGYDNNSNNGIVNTYLNILRIDLDWPQVQYLVSLIKETSNESKIAEYKKEIYDITHLDYDKYESEILAKVKLEDITGLNKAFERFK